MSIGSDEEVRWTYPELDTRVHTAGNESLATREPG